MITKTSQRTRRFDVESVLKEPHLALLFIAPAVLVLVVLIGWSVVYAFVLSFQNLTAVGGKLQHEFVGLANYLRFFDDPRLHQTLGQTIIYTFLRVAGILTISTALAVLLNQTMVGVGLLKRVFLIPWALSNVVNALVWGWIYHGNFGVLNAILQGLHIIKDYHVWLGDPGTALIAIIFADIWKAVPFAALMLLAGMQGLPRDLEDAAKVDGAGPWARFQHVILAWLKPVILVLLVIETMWALKAFDAIWVLTMGGPMDKTMVLNVFAYQQTFRFFKFGYGASVAYLIMTLIMGLTALYVATLRGFED